MAEQLPASGAATQADPAPVGHVRAALSLAILVILTMVSYADRSILQLLVDPIKRDLAITDVQFSILAGFAFASAYAVSTIPAGWLADRYSERWVIFIGVTIWSLATAAGGLADSYSQLFVSRMFVGLGEAMLAPAAYAIVGGLFVGGRLATALGILAAGTSLGSASALVVGGFVVRWAERQGVMAGLEPWQLSLVLLGLPGLMAASLVFIIPSMPRVAAAGGKPTHGESFGAWLWQNKSYVAAISIASGCASALMYGIGTWLPALLMRRYAMDPAEIGVSLGVAVGVSGALGFVLSGAIADRLLKSGHPEAGLRYVMVVVGVAAIVGTLTFSLADSPTTIIMLVAVISFVIPFNGPVLAHLQTTTPPEFRARVLALFMLIFNLMGMSLGATSVALLSDRIFGGPTHLAGGMAAVCAIYGALGVALFGYSLHSARGLRRKATVLSGSFREGFAP